MAIERAVLPEQVRVNILSSEGARSTGAVLAQANCTKRRVEPFDYCRDLLQRGVIHYGTAKASAVTCAPRVGQSLRRHGAALKALRDLARRQWLYTLLTCWIQIEHAPRITV